MAPQSKFGGVPVSKFGGQPVDSQIPGGQELIESGPGAALSALGEFSSGVQRQAAQLAEVLGSPLIAAERQVRPYAQAMMGYRDIPSSAQAAYRGTEPFSPTRDLGIPERGAFMGPGLATDIVSGSGEIAAQALPVSRGTQMLRSAIPETALTGPSRFTQRVAEPTRRVAREVLETTPRQELGFGVTSVAGGEIAESALGEDSKLIGELIAPLAASPLQAGGRFVGQKLFENILNKPSALVELSTTLGSFQDDLAADLLAEAMQREGVTVDQVINQLESLGPEAIPADASYAFRRVLRAAGNVNPRIQGRTARELSERNVRQAERFGSDIELLGTPNLSTDQAIAQIGQRPITLPDGTSTTAAERTAELYRIAGESPLRLSGRVRSMLEGTGSAANAYNKALKTIEDRRQAGDTISHFDIIDETKLVLDDQIRAAMRQGKVNKARNLIRVRNTLIEEADKQIPAYAEARKLYAGTKQLESAAEKGSLFLKNNRRIVIEDTKDMSPAELQMYRIGARQAILDTIDQTNITSDLVKRLFGKNGDIAKLRAIFPDNESFTAFERAMRREAEFSLTRKVATENSTTVQQYEEGNALRQGFNTALNFFRSPAGASAEALAILDGLGQQRNSRAFATALQNAGDILLMSGMKPELLRELIDRGMTKRIGQEIQRVVARQRSAVSSAAAQSLRSATGAQFVGNE